MNDVKSYVPPFQVGQPLEGGAIGEVIESRAPELKAGDIVQSMRGWRDYFVATGRRTFASSIAASHRSRAYLGVLGMPGLTAWVGLKLVELKPGDRVFISGGRWCRRQHRRAARQAARLLRRRQRRLGRQGRSC